MLPRFLLSLGWSRYYWGRCLLSLWPPECRLCQRRSGPLCERCADFLPLHPQRCPVCANPALVRGVCGECRRRPPQFDSLTALGAYRRALRQAIHHVKFQRHWDLLFPLAERLGPDCPPIDVLVPLPLHAARERERGFNQALLLAQILSRQWQVPCRSLLTRVRPTQPQAMLARDLRQANVAGAFAVSAPVPAGSRVGLVDDVFTSGATVQAAAQVLRASGAAAVHVIVLARALPMPRS